jgi:putative membrane protein
VTPEPQRPAADWAWPRGLLLAFGAWFTALGLAPYDRAAWALENVLVVVAIAIFVATRHRLRFSNLSYTLLFVFFVVHEIGAHYTYARVPWAQWLEWASAGSVRIGALARNDYDRVVHFAYGLLVLFILSHAALYEQLEWAATALFSRELGSTYLGAQGDPWDSEWDVLAAVVGAGLALAIMAIAGRGGRRPRAAGT